MFLFYCRMLPLFIKTDKNNYVEQRSDPGQDTDTVALICSKFCRSRPLKKEYGVENVDQMEGVRFLKDLGHDQEEVVLLQSGENKAALKMFPEAPKTSKIILTLYSYLLLLTFFSTPEWPEIEAAAAQHQKKSMLFWRGGGNCQGG